MKKCLISKCKIAGIWNNSLFSVYKYVTEALQLFIMRAQSKTKVKGRRRKFNFPNCHKVQFPIVPSYVHMLKLNWMCSTRFHSLQWNKLHLQDVAMKFPEWFYCKHTCILMGHTWSTPLEQLCTLPNDAVTVGNIFGTPNLE